MPDELESLLRLVSEGRLTPEEAAPLLAALQDRRRASEGAGNSRGAGGAASDPTQGGASGNRNRAGGARDNRSGPGRVQEALANRRIRIYVADNGRQVVNLQIPLGAAGYALDRLPGLTDDYRERISEAIRNGMTGPILEVNDDGDEVRILIE